MKQTRGALKFLIADYKGVLKSALLASSASFFALAANATDIDLTTTTSGNITVASGQTYNLNNGAGQTYSADSITVNDGGKLVIKDGGTFNVNNLTVDVSSNPENFLVSTDTYYYRFQSSADGNDSSAVTTFNVANATFKGGTLGQKESVAVDKPILIDNMNVTGHLDASDAALLGKLAFYNYSRETPLLTFTGATGNIKGLLMRLHLDKGAKVFVDNITYTHFAVNSDNSSAASILAINKANYGYSSEPQALSGFVGNNSALVWGVNSMAEAEQLLTNADLLITQGGKKVLNTSKLKALIYLNKPLSVDRVAVDANSSYNTSNYDASIFGTSSVTKHDVNYSTKAALYLGKNSGIVLSDSLVRAIAVSSTATNAEIDAIDPAITVGDAGRIYFYDSSAVLLDSNTLRAGERYKIVNKGAVLVNLDHYTPLANTSTIDNDIDNSLTVKSLNGNFVSKVKVVTASAQAGSGDGVTVDAVAGTSGSSGTGGTGSGTGNTSDPNNSTGSTAGSGNTSGVSEPVVEVATRSSYFNVSNALYNTFHNAHQAGAYGTGANFLSAVAGESFAGGKEAEQAARLGQLGGVYQSAVSAGRMVDTAVSARTGVANTSGTTITADTQKGFSLWATPLYNYTDADGLNSDGLGYGSSVKLASVAVGADCLSKYNILYGVFFQVGSGDADGNGLANTTKGDVSFWSLGAYGSYNADALAIAFDASYTTLSEDVKSDMNLHSYKRLTADIDSGLFKMGAVGQYTFNFGSVSLIPHAGIRYSTIKVDGYEVKADGLPVANVGSSTANIISVPVGLTLERTIDFGDDLKVKPALNASLTFNFGDTEADFNTTFIGLAADNLKAEIVDDVTYGIGAGLSVTKSNVVVNAGINYLGSENTDSIDVFLKGAYNF